jgi:hypothetical protein
MRTLFLKIIWKPELVMLLLMNLVTSKLSLGNKWISIFIYKFTIHATGLVGWFMVFNTTFNNISAILWQSVLLVEKIEVTGENHRPVASHWQTLSHNVACSTPHFEWGSNSQLFHAITTVLLLMMIILSTLLIRMYSSVRDKSWRYQIGNQNP